MDQRIQHFPHQHSLTLKEKKNDGPLQFCKGCLEPVFGPHYTCDTCNDKYLYSAYKFNIHKSCAELPLEIHQHPIHPKHPLILGETFESKCGICNCSQSDRRGYILSYCCSECNFSIDVKCASSWQNVGHEHNFTILRKPMKFTCDVCGQGDGSLKHNFYLCNICQLLVHGKCSWLPLQVKIKRHQHRLKLTWWFQDMYPEDQDFCDICSLTMDGNRAMYCCHDHECRGYAAHCKCIRTEGKIMNVLVDVNYDDDPSTSRRPPTDETTADDEPLHIKHFSHQHMLTLIDGQEVARQDNEDERITCNGCTLPIIRGESYRSCTEQEIDKPCNFSLHIKCAKLPQKMLNPLHRHELTLLPTPYVGGRFKCDMCKSVSQGFSYHCQDCSFDLDLYCSILVEK